MLYFIKEGLLKCGLYLQGGLYSGVAFSTGLTVFKSLKFVVISIYLEWFKVFESVIIISLAHMSVCKSIYFYLFLLNETTVTHAQCP